MKQLSARSARIRDRWQNHITDQQASGLTQANYCREHQLNAKYFSLWKAKLRSSQMQGANTVTPKTEKTKLIPVVIKSNPALSVTSGISVKATLRNGMAVELMLQHDVELLSVLTQLAQLSC